ncbi:MAG: twin-arginine translocation signal domain-containing protein [Planctomycetes bacterium]|nr:twin-arginine translocation signal domain-containing protein [Planctomycetota bacterium]
MSHQNRRQFLKSSTAAAAAASLPYSGEIRLKPVLQTPVLPGSCKTRS